MVALAKAERALSCDPINRLEEALAKLPQAEIPTSHLFTPGLYSRSVLMRKGNVFTSKIHGTKHPFVVSQGKCLVFDEEGNRTLITAPHMGVTEPGTRRAILILEDCIWTCFHATELTDLAEIEKALIIPREAPVVEDGSKCIRDIFLSAQEASL